MLTVVITFYITFISIIYSQFLHISLLRTRQR